MKLLNTYLKYDGKITEEQFNQCIEIAKSLGYNVSKNILPSIPNNYTHFIKTTGYGGYFVFRDKAPGYVAQVVNHCSIWKEITLQDILNCKQSITFNYLIL